MPRPEEEGLYDFPKRLPGDFIMEHIGSKGVQTNNGMWFHYADVVTMLNKAINSDMSDFKYTLVDPASGIEARNPKD